MNKSIKPNDRKISQILVRIILLLVMLLMAYFAQDCLAIEDTVDDEDVVVQEVIMENVCSDEQLKCLDEPNSKTRIVDKMAVTQECWKYEYVKNCNKVLSKNDCRKISPEKFSLSKEECLTTTKMGARSFCLNMKKTFAHSFKVNETIDQSEIIMDPDNKEAVKDLLCEAFCLDGNCSSVFKASQETNNEMASSIAQLEMLSKIKQGLVDANSLKFDIFSASVRRCHNKTGVHSNCCNNTGLFKSAGLVKCSPEAKALNTEGRKGRCEYIGEYCANKKLGVCLRKTKSYCCFPTVLAKTIHRGARKQLNKNLGSAKHPNCGGLTLAEIEAIDFSQIDFKEFFDLELQQMMKGYDAQDNEALMKRSFPNGVNNTGEKFPNSNEDGVNEKLFKDSEGEGR